jgi:hypothetical protein
MFCIREDGSVYFNIREDESVIQVSLRQESEKFFNMFWIRGDESVYFNIRENESVIQTSLKGWDGNLL